MNTQTIKLAFLAAAKSKASPAEQILLRARQDRKAVRS
jgi:hypothetical protein